MINLKKAHWPIETVTVPSKGSRELRALNLGSISRSCYQWIGQLKHLQLQIEFFTSIANWISPQESECIFKLNISATNYCLSYTMTNTLSKTNLSAKFYWSHISSSVLMLPWFKIKQCLSVTVVGCACLGLILGLYYSSWSSVTHKQPIIR